MNPILFASTGLDNDPVIDTWMTPQTKEALLVVGALVVVVGLIMIWVTLIRRKPRRHKHHHHQQTHSQIHQHGLHQP